MISAREGRACLQHPVGPGNEDCQGYYNCWHGDEPMQFCGSGQRFNPTTKNCDWSRNVACDAVTTEAPGTTVATTAAPGTTATDEPTTTANAVTTTGSSDPTGSSVRGRRACMPHPWIWLATRIAVDTSTASGAMSLCNSARRVSASIPTSRSATGMPTCSVQ